MTVAPFFNWHKGDDIWVLGSGATLSHVNPEFFRGKIVVATNRVAERMGLYDMRDVKVYTHTHYHAEDAVPLARQYPRHLFFAPNGEQGHAGLPQESDRLRNITYYPHQPTKYGFTVEEAWPPVGGLIVGSTSLHGSMHLACVMGARNVILVGADCGLLDGRTNQGGYVSGNLRSDPLPFLARWNQHLIEVASELREVYGVNIYSLNPFVNLNLEGHEWVSPV
jgi:hypothetical protein